MLISIFSSWSTSDNSCVSTPINSTFNLYFLDFVTFDHCWQVASSREVCLWLIKLLWWPLPLPLPPEVILILFTFLIYIQTNRRERRHTGCTQEIHWSILVLAHNSFNWTMKFWFIYPTQVWFTDTVFCFLTGTGYC